MQYILEDYKAIKDLADFSKNSTINCLKLDHKKKIRFFYSFIFGNMKKSAHLLILFVICSTPIFAENYIHAGAAEKYISNFKSNAIKEMILYKIPASITLAQGMLESQYGNSDLARLANNHFGIKCHKEWSGPCFIKDDDEKDECFRKYSTVLESYTDHSQFLKARPWYAKLFLLDHTDYNGWAYGLKEAGYATDPKYPQRLISLIKMHQLYRFDTAVPIQEIQTSELAKSETKPDVIKNEIILKPTILNAPSNVKATIKTAQSNEREILRLGTVKYIIVKPDDTFLKIAQDTDKDLWQLFKYNDLLPNAKLVVGQKLFLQPKRRKGIELIHVVKLGETMQSISQSNGIKLKLLYARNKMVYGEEPFVGQKIFLSSKGLLLNEKINTK